MNEEKYLHPWYWSICFTMKCNGQNTSNGEYEATENKINVFFHFEVMDTELVLSGNLYLVALMVVTYRFYLAY